MKTMTRVTSDTDLEGILDMLQNWVGDDVQKNLRHFTEKGDVTLEMPDADLRNDLWDGTLLVRFNREFSAAEVVNSLIDGCQADELRYIDARTLRLWWD
jgi:hypothetical protein